MTTFSQLRLASSAQNTVTELLSRASTANKRDVEQALVALAESNGDLYLSAQEAQIASEVFTRVGFTPAAMTELSAKGKLRSRETSGIAPHFTGELETKLIAELQDAVQRAAGRPLDVNMMIFEFQSDPIEAAIANIARSHPNVTLRIIGDSTQASNVGGNALPSLLKLKLPNIQVKFKRDFPYVWSADKGRAVYNHGATGGLNHHKGFATLIDGMPDRMVTGSFNWSKTANEKNYEDMVIVRGVDAGTRRAISHYTNEFTGFFNNRDAALSPNAFSNFRSEMTSRLAQRNGANVPVRRPLPNDDYADYVPKNDDTSFDVNGFRETDVARLTKLAGARVAKAIADERNAFGRFASLDELKERVPAVARLSAKKLEDLALLGSFGTGLVSLNDASVEELQQAGVPSAAELVRARAASGAFRSLADAAFAAGVSSAAFASLQGVLTLQGLEAFFNSRPFGAAAGGTGYGTITGTREVPVAIAPGSVEVGKASVTVAALDMFNRANAGERIRVAMYGMSASSPETKALIDAAKRGVSVQVVLNDDFNGGVAATLKGTAGIQVRIQKARTMHEKFGVSGSDVFWGSANFSESSSTKHSEDRFALRGNKEVAEAFETQFENLWGKSKEA
jgi:DNA uptake protein ComE-like DNA-binding protein